MKVVRLEVKVPYLKVRVQLSHNFQVDQKEALKRNVRAILKFVHQVVKVMELNVKVLQIIYIQNLQHLHQMKLKK